MAASQSSGLCDVCSSASPTSSGMLKLVAPPPSCEVPDSDTLSRSDPAAVDALSEELSALDPGGGPRASASSSLRRVLCSWTRASRDHATDLRAISCHFSASSPVGALALSCAAISSARATSVATRTRLARTAPTPAARLPALAKGGDASCVLTCLPGAQAPEPTRCWMTVSASRIILMEGEVFAEVQTCDEGNAKVVPDSASGFCPRCSKQLKILTT